MGRAQSPEEKSKPWWKETGSAGSQMLSDQIPSWTEAVFFCLLVVTAELCHWAGFLFTWFSYEKRRVWVFEQARRSHPQRVLPRLQNAHFLWHFYLSWHRNTESICFPFPEHRGLKEANVQSWQSISDTSIGGLWIRTAMPTEMSSRLLWFL